jgi:DNA-directed RNA polymerase specialized sigma24 family protein
MPVGLSAHAFGLLLGRLDPDRERAAERYEELRRILVGFFEWRGAPFPEEHTDDTFDRVARKLAEGVAIENIGGYAYRVARLVFLETLKAPASRRAALEPQHGRPASDASEAADKERRLACLDDCLRQLPADNRELIVRYYREGGRARIEERRRLAERMGLRVEALANRAQRLRDKLERCVGICLGGKST